MYVLMIACHSMAKRHHAMQDHRLYSVENPDSPFSVLTREAQAGTSCEA